MAILTRVRSTLSAVCLLAFWDLLRSSFWFLPNRHGLRRHLPVDCPHAHDAEIEEDLYRRLSWVYLFGPEGARAIQSAIASSMITVAGLTFSITMLTLQLASSQFGPRLLRNFMRDRGYQLVSAPSSAPSSTACSCCVPSKASKARASCRTSRSPSACCSPIASLAVLIYFIHHTAHSIRIENAARRPGGGRRAIRPRQRQPSDPRREERLCAVRRRRRADGPCHRARSRRAKSPSHRAPS